MTNSIDSSRYLAARYEDIRKRRTTASALVESVRMARNAIGKNQTVLNGRKLINPVSERHIELYENITGRKFEKSDTNNVLQRVEHNIRNFLLAYYR